MEKYTHPRVQSKRTYEVRIGNISSVNKPKEKSWEEHWRDERYNWLKSEGAFPILTGHNLDDAVETWIWSSMHGEGKVMPFRNGSILRPLLITKKSTLQKWCDSHEVPYFRDPGNEDRKYMRSIVRHDIMPHALKVNPGLYKVVKKKVLKAFEREEMLKET
jgi:tRNA(Ile)-lysidine synthase